MNEIEFKRLSAKASKPTRNLPDDAGIDIYSAETVVIEPQEKIKLATDLAVNIPPGYVGLLTSRSGVSSKTDLVITDGKIDAGYQGHVSIIIKNDSQRHDLRTRFNNRLLMRKYEPLLYLVDGEKYDNNNPFHETEGKSYLIRKGDKIAQLLLVKIATPQPIMVDDFNTTTERGENGFGSSGYGEMEYKTSGTRFNISELLVSYDFPEGVTEDVGNRLKDNDSEDYARQQLRFLERLINNGLATKKEK